MLSDPVLKQLFLLQVERKCSQCNLHYMQAMLEPGIPIFPKKNFLPPGNGTLSSNCSLDALPNGYAGKPVTNVQRRFQQQLHCTRLLPGEYHFLFLWRAHKIFHSASLRQYNKTREVLANPASF